MGKCPACRNGMERRAVLCVHCGFDRRIGRRIVETPLPAGLAPPAAPERERAPPMAMAPRPHKPVVLPWSEYGAPVTATVVSLLLLTIHAFVFPPQRIGSHWLGLFLEWFFGTGVLVATVLIASRWGALEFGDVSRGVMKCSAVMLPTLAALTWLPDQNVVATWLTGLPALGTAIEVLLPMVVRLVVTLLLVRLFFGLDRYELVLIVLAQWLVSLVLVPLRIVIAQLF